MFKKIIAGSVLALLSTLSLAAGNNYYVVVPFKDKVAPIKVALTPATLPSAEISKAYQYDFASSLIVTGDPSFSSDKASWSLSEDSAPLPQGLTLSGSGTLSGTPSVVYENGAPFKITATYAGQRGSQDYSLAVLPEADPYWSNVTALFNFDTPASVSQASVGGTFTPYGGVSLGTGKFGHGAAMGSTYAAINGASSLCNLGTGDFTLELWFYSSSYANTMLSCDDNWASNHTGWSMTRNAFQLWDTAGNYVGTSASFDSFANQWHHLAVTRKGTVYTFFVDGSPRASTTGGAPSQTTSAFHVGSPGGGSIVGLIDEVRVTRGVARYSGSFTPRAQAFPTR